MFSLVNISIFVTCGLLRGSSADQFGVVWVQDNCATCENVMCLGVFRY